MSSDDNYGILHITNYRQNFYNALICVLFALRHFSFHIFNINFEEIYILIKGDSVVIKCC
jgi:hypothetical protein